MRLYGFSSTWVMWWWSLNCAIHSPCLTHASTVDSCVRNEILQGFDFAYPTEGVLVPKNIHMKVIGEFFDPPFIVKNNDQFSVCVSLNGQEISCSNLFDETAITFPDGQGRHQISAAFCPKNVDGGCLCNVSIWVECCGEPVVAADTTRPSSQTLQIIQELKNKIRSNRSARHFPPWSCR